MCIQGSEPMWNKVNMQTAHADQRGGRGELCLRQVFTDTRGSRYVAASDRAVTCNTYRRTGVLFYWHVVANWATPRIRKCWWWSKRTFWSLILGNVSSLQSLWRFLDFGLRDGDGMRRACFFLCYGWERWWRLRENHQESNWEPPSTAAVFRRYLQLVLYDFQIFLDNIKWI